LSKEKLEGYLASLYHNKNVRVESFGELGKDSSDGELKGFGYGNPVLIRYSVDGVAEEAVINSMREGGFGHDHFSDRAQSLLWAHSCDNKLPLHVKSLDVGAFRADHSMISAGDVEEFFQLMRFTEGELYFKDLERMMEEGSVRELDRRRCRALSDYLVEIHGLKMDSPQLYTRRTRDLIGHGECIMGLIDSYPRDLDYLTPGELAGIEKKCVDWRWRLVPLSHRLSRVHGDFHPFNILFRENTDFSVLDRSRGEWGEPADDLSAMIINYVFFSLRRSGKLEGGFEELFLDFIENYLEKTGDREIMRVIQPYFAWRSLVIASPIWYPHLKVEIRRKIFNFIHNVLDSDVFDYRRINEFLENEDARFAPGSPR
jgi:tRNA A-37 threonylcarbamoyl transferase component Bud32